MFTRPLLNEKYLNKIRYHLAQKLFHLLPFGRRGFNLGFNSDLNEDAIVFEAIQLQYK